MISGRRCLNAVWFATTSDERGGGRTASIPGTFTQFEDLAPVLLRPYTKHPGTCRLKFVAPRIR